MVCGGYLVETLTLNLPLDCKEREEESVIWEGWEREEECGGWWEEGGREVARRLASPRTVDVSPFCSIIVMVPFVGVCCGDGVGMGSGEVEDEGGYGEGRENPCLANALRVDGGMQPTRGTE